MNDNVATIEQLRAEIDALDDQMHDLLMRRAELVQEIGAAKRPGAVFRPAREAALVRRLVERHEGRFPKRVIVSLWREMIGAYSMLQGATTVSVYSPEGEYGYFELARTHYGTYVPINSFKTISQVINSVSKGSAAVGVLPLPREDDADPWWRNILGTDNDPPRVAARLPFMLPAKNNLEALAIGRVELQGSGHDRSYVALEINAGVSRARIVSTLTEYKLKPRFFAMYEHRADPDSALILIEVNGFVENDDERLERLVLRNQDIFSHAVPIGSYAIPFDAGRLKDDIRR